MKKILTWLLVSAVLFIAGFLVCYKCVKEPVFGEVKTVIDTSTFYDTSFFEGPKLSELIVKRYPKEKDTIRIPAEAEIIHDSIYYTVPREEVEYRDSSFRAVVSGFLPRLEELEIYQKERIVTIQTERIIKPSPWAISIQGGYGVSAKGLTPYIGVGLSYNIYSFKQRRSPP